MIVGGVAGGYASDSLLGGRRALVSCGMLLAAVVALLALVRATAWSLPWLSFAVGFWLGGPSTLVNGCVACSSLQWPGMQHGHDPCPPAAAVRQRRGRRPRHGPEAEGEHASALYGSGCARTRCGRGPTHVSACHASRLSATRPQGSSTASAASARRWGRPWSALSWPSPTAGTRRTDRGQTGGAHTLPRHTTLNRRSLGERRTNVLTLVMAVTSVAALLLMQRSAEEVQSMRAKADSPVA